MSNTSNIVYHKRLKQFSPIAYKTTFENSKQIAYKTAKGSFQLWAEGDVEILTKHQADKLMDLDDMWDNPTEETLALLSL